MRAGVNSYVLIEVSMMKITKAVLILWGGVLIISKPLSEGLTA
jgi:hypothetical protein